MFWFSFSGPSRCSGKGLGLSLISWGFGGFPLQSSQISQDVWCYSLTTDLQFQLLALIGLGNWGVLCDSPSTCLSENQYILVPESCLSLLGQMVGSVYNLVPRAFPLENGRSAKALGTRIKLTAKTAGTKILLLVSVGSLEKRTNQSKYKESKTRSPRTTVKVIQNNVYCFFITIFRLAIPAFFRFTDVTELM